PRQDVRFDERMIDEYSKFANKLWNITRLVLMNAGGVELDASVEGGDDPFDQWILSRLDGLVETVTAAIEGYRPSEAIRAMYDFAWKELADWYLEAAKPRFRLEPGDAGRRQAVNVSLHCVGVLVRLLHPVMPFISQALWDRLPGGGSELIGRGPGLWPLPEGRRNPELEVHVTELFSLIRMVRDARKELGAGERERLGAVLKTTGRGSELLTGEAGRACLGLLAGLDLVDSLDGTASRVVVGEGVEVLLAVRNEAPLNSAAWNREVEAARANIDRLDRRLANPDFVGKARAEVVQGTREQLQAARERLTALEEAQG
ncbi:MAG: class I tRNA ligase family protein, partial [Candidatus Dormibacteria bacterium]